MALPATFAFTGTDGATLQATSGSWTAIDGQMSINTNQLVNDDPGTAENAYYWNADTFSGDHSSEVTYTAAGTRRLGVGVRMGGTSYYGFYGFNAGSYGEQNLVEVNSGGAPSTLGTNSTRIFVNDVLKLEASGSTITARVNGSVASFGAVTDSTITGGAAGVVGRGQSTVARIDNWTGDDIGGGASATRGTPFGHRGTAFNGGRTFHGIIQ